MNALLAVSLLAACGGGNKQAPTALPPENTGSGAATGGLVIVDDIDCPKLVNHMVDVHVAATPERSAEKADEVKQIRVDMVKKCEERWATQPPTEDEKTSARCSMKATTPEQLETCGS